ncbi:SpoIIIAH-like family protein [Brevibacillus sp. TJ4]|uniref:SpoIIIAH-like family protein n=1 Tax=Brevibacillus sp. TJ4 TaxID=3234853 RepID=UPI0037D016E2
MMLKRQTVWLLTMLAVMVVLSGYYLARGPQEQVPVSGEQQAVNKQDPIAGVVVESKQVDQPPEATPVEAPDTENTEAPVPTGGLPMPVADTPSEVFQGYKMKREAQIQQQKDEQLAIMSNPDSSPQAVAEAKAKHEELSTLDNATLTVEEMLKASGYQDAVVFMQDDKVTVIVQKDQLSASEAVEIIAHVKQQLNVPATNVTVKFQSS